MPVGALISGLPPLDPPRLGDLTAHQPAAAVAVGTWTMPVDGWTTTIITPGTSGPSVRPAGPVTRTPPGPANTRFGHLPNGTWTISVWTATDDGHEHPAVWDSGQSATITLVDPHRPEPFTVELPGGILLSAVPADPESCFLLDKITGLDSTDLRDSGSMLPDRDGETLGPIRRTARTLTLDITVVGEDRVDADTRLAALRRASRPVQDTWPLLIRGRAPGPDVLTIDVRPSQPFQHAHGDGWDARLRACQITLRAPDPRLYDTVWRSATVFPPTGVGGITFPITWPVDWGGSAYLGTPVVTDGDDDTPPILTVFGPITDPVISNITTGENIVLTGTVASGKTLVVDPLARTVLLDGDPSQSRYHWVDGSTTRWWLLAPGANQIGLLGTGTDGNSRLGILWRDSWL